MPAKLRQIYAVTSFTLILSCVCNQPIARAVDDVAGTLITFNDNGAWSWFQDDRVVFDQKAGSILVSSVANASGKEGRRRKGDVEIAAYELDGGKLSRFTLSPQLQEDDHDSAALWIRPDGHYLAMYSKHHSDPLSRYRISKRPGDITAWTPERSFNNGVGTTYSNLFYLPNDNNGAGRLYNFTRTVNFNPNFIVSDDLGETWAYGGRLLTVGRGNVRPYVRYASDGRRIHLITTDHHPRNADTSIFYAYIKNGQLFNSTASLLDSNLFDSSASQPGNLTQVLAAGTKFGGVPMHHAWTIDLEIDVEGQPYAVFVARAKNDTSDHRFFYARFEGTEWKVYELAKAGGYLYESEDDYTGLVALDPSNPDRLFISSKVDPRNECEMVHYEIFEGVTADRGVSWSWSPITAHSRVDNLRPIVPKWEGEDTALLWLRGKYETYKNYDLAVVGLTKIIPLSPQTIELKPAEAKPNEASRL